MSKEPDAAGRRDKRLSIIRIAVVVVLGALTAIVVLQNTEYVETRILFATIVMPRAVLLFTTFALGLVLGMTLSFVRRRSKK